MDTTKSYRNNSLGAFPGVAVISLPRSINIAIPFETHRCPPFLLQERQGMSGAKLEAMRELLAGKGTKALLVVRNDRIVCE